jgi:hypothetical protein
MPARTATLPVRLSRVCLLGSMSAAIANSRSCGRAREQGNSIGGRIEGECQTEQGFANAKNPSQIASVPSPLVKSHSPSGCRNSNGRWRDKPKWPHQRNRRSPETFSCAARFRHVPGTHRPPLCWIWRGPIFLSVRVGCSAVRAAVYLPVNRRGGINN